MKRATIIIAALLMALSMTGCGVSVPSDMARIHMGDGMFENKTPKGCVAPGTKDNSITNDEYPLYPVNEREWDASVNDDADSGRYKSVTKDNVEMYIPLNVRFNLIAPMSEDEESKDDERCATLIEFHMKYGRRYGVEFEDDGSYNDEWIDVLRRLIHDPVETSLDRIVQGYNWRDVYNNPDTKTEIEEKLLDPSMGIVPFIERSAKGTFFENFAVSMGSAEPVNDSLQAAIAEEQNLVASSQARKAEAEAQEAEARARVAVARAEAAEQRAKIAGFGGTRAYLQYLCISTPTCGNPYRDQFLYGDTP